MPVFYENIECATNSTDIEKPSFELNVFPNPVAEVLNFTSNEPIDKIEIYDTFGRLIDVFYQPTSSIPVHKLPSGIYIAKFHVGANGISKKIVKI